MTPTTAVPDTRAVPVEPTTPTFMPTIEQYMALAEAMHDGDDLCNANYYAPFGECGNREYDIQQAVKVLVALRKEGWQLVREPINGIPLAWPHGDND